MNLLYTILIMGITQQSGLTVSSTSFKNGENIPSVYTCEDRNATPSLTVSDIPRGVKSLAFIMDDPDAPGGNFNHWVLFNIPNTEGMEKITIGDSTKCMKGANGADKNGYTGPCPPSGVHHYHFKAYALDVMLNLKEGSTKKDVEDAMKDHIIAQGEMIALYQKEKR